MLSTSSITLKSVVKFSQYAPAVLGNGYEGATVLAILDWESAQAYINPATVHASVYPLLPDGSPSDYKSYPYLKIRTESGQTTAVGLPWIDESTYVVEDTAKMTIVLDSVSPDDQNKVKLALAAIGMSNFTVTIG